MKVNDIAKPEPKRDRWGRYLVEGVAHTRTTTIAKILEDTYGLELWKQRQVVLGLAARDDLMALAATTTDYGELNKLCEDAMDAAKSSEGANLGTALHKATEHLDYTGEIQNLPGDLGERVKAYGLAMKRSGITLEMDHIEQILLSDWGWDSIKIAGTADRVVILPDGRKVIADLKTAKPNAKTGECQLGWQGIAVQLGIYANHDQTYDVATDTVGPKIADLDTSTGLVIWLPARGEIKCEFYLLDLHAGHEAAEYSIWTYQWRKRKDLAERVNFFETEEENRGGSMAIIDWVRSRIAYLRDNDHKAAINALRQGWPEESPKPITDSATDAELEPLIAVIDAIEARFDIPFGPTRPGATVIEPPPKAPAKKVAAKKAPAKKAATKKAATKKVAAKKTPAKKAATKKAPAKKAATKKAAVKKATAKKAAKKVPTTNKRKTTK